MQFKKTSPLFGAPMEVLSGQRIYYICTWSLRGMGSGFEGFRVYSRSPKVGNPIASTLKSNVKRNPSTNCPKP